MASVRAAWLLSPLIHIVSLLLPLQWRKIPNTYSNVPLGDDAASTKVAIVFSHGLTGTGQENALLLAAWASLGFIVVSVHHTDGSSSLVRLKDGTDLDYKHGPKFENYDATFRPIQVEHRAKELLQACDFSKSLYESIECFGIAGFSFGAATAARAVTMAPHKFTAAVLLDGWFYIDVSESAGIEFRMPKQAFGENRRLQEIPCLFVNSERFANMPKLYQATRQLANNDANRLHVIDGTGHYNFCDVVFWAPKFVLSLMFGKSMGYKDPHMAYREIVEITSDFLVKHLKCPDNNKKREKNN